jgi:uncharacterized membrane protein
LKSYNASWLYIIAYIPTPRGTYMSLEDWVKIIGYVATGVLIVVRIWVWHRERKVKAEKQKLAIKASRGNT